MGSESGSSRGLAVLVVVAALAGYWVGTRRAGPTTAEERKLEIFHWWTAGGEREAADAMFKAFKAKHPDVEIVENPVAGGGGVSHRVVLQARLSAGIPPDTWQTLGGAELKSYVDGKYLEPLDDLWNELKYREVIPKPLADAVTIGGHPYVVPLNMHIQNIPGRTVVRLDLPWTGKGVANRRLVRDLDRQAGSVLRQRGMSLVGREAHLQVGVIQLGTALRRSQVRG